jgi:hypothetical protein
LRFSVVGQLLAAPPEKGALAVAIADLAAREWRHPTTGAPVRFGASTIERWYYRALRARQDPVGALRRRRRRDAGRQTAMSDRLRQALLAQYAAHKSWSAQLHHDNLAALVERRPELGGAPSYSTVRRFLHAHGLMKHRPRSVRQTAGALAAEARLAEREVRSYEAEHVNGLWHWDFHHRSCKVLTARGEWRTPLLLGILDDRSRLACHLQWYLHETAENVAHGLMQAFQKRGLPRAAMSDNGAAMTAAEITQGLGRLGILHRTTLPLQPLPERQTGGLLGAGRGPPDGDARRGSRSEPGATQRGNPGLGRVRVQPQAPLGDRRNAGRPLSRRADGDPALPGQRGALKLAFTRADRRALRHSDGTILIAGRRFEVPNRYRHLSTLELRFADWDLSLVHLVDEQTGAVLCRLFPLDKTANASGRRRSLEPLGDGSPAGMAPLLVRLLEERAASGLPPAYLVKDEEP